MEITGTSGLPVGYSYWYEAENDKEFIIKIKEISKEESALNWVKHLSSCSFTMWRVDKTYRQGYEILFKKHFRCHHSGTISSKDTKCKALMNIRIMRTRTVDQWPCVAHFRGRHNHEVGAPFSIIYHPITEDIKKEIINLFKSGYHQYSAYSAYCKKNISQLGLDSWAYFGDKYIFPTKEDFRELWMRYVRDVYVAKMSKKKQMESADCITTGETSNHDDSTEDNSTMEVQDLDEEYFGKRMIDETNIRLDANIGKPLENIKPVNTITLAEKGNLKTETKTLSTEQTLCMKQSNPSGCDNSISKKERKYAQYNCHGIETPNQSALQNILRRIKPKLENMTKEQLIALCVQKIVEEISAKATVRDLHKLLHSQKNSIRNDQSYSNRDDTELSGVVNIVLCTLCNEHKKIGYNQCSNNEIISQQNNNSL